jgi:di-N-acetylchitobiase
MGIPWYGYSYGCTNVEDGVTLKTCEIKQIPFQGVNCSDAAGFELPYATIMSMYENPE